MRRSQARLAGACVLIVIAAITLNACGNAPALVPEAPTSAATSAETTDFGRLIEAESAAVYALGVIGAHMSGAQRARVIAELRFHERLRDAWILGAEADGQEVPPAAIAYDLPIDVRDRETADALWIEIERRLIAVYESAGPIAVDQLVKSRARLGRLTPNG